MSEIYNDKYCKTEMINGIEIIMMSPPFLNHNVVKDNVLHIFRSHLKNNICRPYGDNVKVVLEDDSYVIPDFFVVCDKSKRKRDGIHGAPDLIAEVLSPSTEKTDRGEKKDLYQRVGVKEYWIIEPNKKVIEVYLLKGNVYVLNAVYRIPADYEPTEDKEKEPLEFEVSSFKGLTVQLCDVFEDVVAY